jgi:hypothetical protein
MLKPGPKLAFRPVTDHKEDYSKVIQELKDKTEELERKLDLLSQILHDEIEGRGAKWAEDKPNRCFWDNVVPLVMLVVTVALMSLRDAGGKEIEPEPGYPMNYTEFRR